MRRALAVALLLLAAALVAAGLHDRQAPAAGAWLERDGLPLQHAEVGGRSLAFVRSGSGPAVVLVHGFGSSIYTWKDVIRGLAPRHDVIALDLPGFGASDRPTDLSFEDLPRAVVGLIDRLGIARAALVGNSLGGATVALVAATQPGRVSRLVLVDAAGFNFQPGARPLMFRLATSRAAPVLELLPGKRLLVARALRQVFHDDSLVTRERVAEYLAPLASPGTFAALRSLGSSLEGRASQVEDALGRIAAPTLVVWGADDRWIPPAHADRFVSAISGARKVVIPACGHVPQEERPAEVGRLLLEFLSEAGSARAQGHAGSEASRG